MEEQDWALANNLDAVAALLRGEAARDLKEEDLTPGGVTILELALVQEGATSSLLASLLGISRQAASKAVQVLVEQGLLVANTHPDDARAQCIKLTDAGKQAVVRSRARRAPSLAKFMAPLSSKERAQMTEFLERLRLTARPQLQKADVLTHPAHKVVDGVVP